MNRTGKKPLKPFPVIWATCRKVLFSAFSVNVNAYSSYFSHFGLPWHFSFLYSTAPCLSLCYSHDCWVSNLAVDWVRGRSLVLSTSFGLWRLMPPDTLSSISPGRIILVMQKSSGSGIAWGLSSGNPNNLNLIEFLLKNAKINEWIKLLLCLIGLHHVVCDRCVFGEMSLKCSQLVLQEEIKKYFKIFACI